MTTVVIILLLSQLISWTRIMFKVPTMLIQNASVVVLHYGQPLTLIFGLLSQELPKPAPGLSCPFFLTNQLRTATSTRNKLLCTIAAVVLLHGNNTALQE
jgi:hypothetical protein